MSQHGDCPELEVRSVALLPLDPKVTAWVGLDA